MTDEIRTLTETEARKLAAKCAVLRGEEVPRARQAPALRRELFSRG